MTYDLRTLEAAMRAAGWRVRKAKHGWVAYPADTSCSPVKYGGTPSDHRAIRNVVSGLRRGGLTI